MTRVERSHRRSIAAIAVQFFLNGFIYASVIPRLPEVTERLDLGIDVLGLVLTLAAVVGLLASFAAGLMVETVGSRLVMVGSAGVVAFSFPIIGLAGSVPWLLVGLALWQAFDVGTDAAMNLQASRISESRAVPIMNRMHGMWSLGTVAGGLTAAGLTALGVGLDVHLVAVGSLLAIAQLLIYPNLLGTDESANDRSSGQGQRRVGLLTMFLLGAAALVLELVPAEWSAFRLAEDLITTDAVAALGFVSFTAGMVLGRLSGDWVEVRVSRGSFDTAAVVVASGGLGIATFVDSSAVVLLALFITGIGVGVIIPALYDSAARTVRPGLALGSLSAGIRFGAIVAPVLVGVIAVRLGVGTAMALVALPCAGVLLTRSLKS